MTTTVLAAFSVDHASRITGLSKSRLTRWDKLGFFSPEYVGDEDRGNPYSRVYSYVDLVGLRTLAILTDKYHVPLSELRLAAAELAKRVNRPWSEIELAVLKRKVVWDIKTDPRNVTDGQGVLKAIPLPSIASEIALKAEALRKRKAALHGKKERHKFVAHNAWVVAGTRIPISAIQSFIKAGYADSAIIAEYPSLTIKDIRAVRNRRAAA